MDNCIHLAPAVISIQEHRSADGLDRHVPVILSDGVLYDADLDRFFLDLPLNGVRSPHRLHWGCREIFFDSGCKWTGG